ncbi:TIGR02281 family clan AA aspartic protease [Methylocaldum szegediense]|uniref:retropepsin-like aspartic protease family protein n=1 Tax=Methylocaldum szegediense TaxID=73780 RepID=UPI000429130E|nr:retropepsin-like aspartic protease [Methylocaldum szegediense]
MKQLILAIIGILPLATPVTGGADERIAMRQSEAGTFYIPVHIEGVGATDFLVDTGSSHTTINEATLAVLKSNGMAKYAYDIKGVMADGAAKVVPVNSIRSIDIGHLCVLKDVEAAVFPGESRQILGLSALSKVSSVVFTMSPPSLQLHDCDGGNARTAASAP